MAQKENDDFLKGIRESAEMSLEEVAKAISGRQSAFPALPYTPMIKGITMSAAIREEITNVPGSFLKLYAQYPYGYKAISRESEKKLVPSFTTISKEGTSVPSEGELYVGFKNIKPAQSLAVLIAVEEGSSNPELPDPNVSWTYLQQDEWKPFSASMLYDGTKGLIQSGILSIVLPDADITENTLLPAGYLWLRASVPFNQSNAVCRILSVHTQAVQVAFDDRDNTPAYLGTNIPAGTIANLSPKISSLKKVTQPLPSSGGRKTEDPEHLYTRVSERLRHKTRGITAWDYENIILEAFPDIYKVKVLHHACAYKGTGNTIEKIISKAGSVLILTVPKTYALSSVYSPLVSKAKLTAIYEFIRPLVSSFAKITVMNPLFEAVAVTAVVVFRSNVKDKLYYENMLQYDIRRFLSPWAYDEGLEPEFGGVIYTSAVMDFIEELPYVDYVQSLELSHIHSVAGDMAKASSPASVLISAAQHIVSGILNDSSEKQLNTNTIAFC